MLCVQVEEDRSDGGSSLPFGAGQILGGMAGKREARATGLLIRQNHNLQPWLTAFAQFQFPHSVADWLTPLRHGFR